MNRTNYFTRMKSTFLPFALVMAFGMYMISCAPAPKESDEEELEDPVDIDVTEADNPEDNSFLYALPSPLQIASIFRRSGLEYIPDITNDPSNVSNYNVKFMQKLNFGVYAADLAYSALNEKNQDCIDYVNSLSQLSESLWMTNVFSSVSILNRFENNMGNADSLGYIIADFQMELDSYLEENGLSSNSLIIFSGAWIESMHIAFSSLQSDANPQLMGRLIEQKKIADNLVEVLGREESDADLDKLIGHLKNINGHFASFDVESIETEEDLEKLRLTDEQITAAVKDIEEARNFIING